MIIKKIKTLILIMLLATPIFCQNKKDVCPSEEFKAYSPDFQWRQLKGTLPEKEDLVLMFIGNSLK